MHAATRMIRISFEFEAQIVSGIFLQGHGCQSRLSLFVALVDVIYGPRCWHSGFNLLI